MADAPPSVRALTTDDADWTRSILERGWGSTEVARLGELIDAAHLPGYVAVVDDRPAGVATFTLRSDGLEVVTLQSLVPGRGIGRALMDRLERHGRDEGADRLWLITTNDNLRAFEFYQRWGMDLVRVVERGVERSRLIKPGIPERGANGIALRHELEFELLIGPGPSTRPVGPDRPDTAT